MSARLVQAAPGAGASAGAAAFASSAHQPQREVARPVEGDQRRLGPGLGLRVNLACGRNRADVSAEFLALGDASKHLQQLHAGLIYVPVKNVELGTELIWGRRVACSGPRGTLGRLDLMARYAF